jgi:hypothetical protein
VKPSLTAPLDDEATDLIGSLAEIALQGRFLWVQRGATKEVDVRLLRVVAARPGR